MKKLPFISACVISAMMLLACVSSAPSKPTVLEFRYEGYNDSQNIVPIIYQLVKSEKKTNPKSIWKNASIDNIAYEKNAIVISNVMGADKISYYNYSMVIAVLDGVLTIAFDTPKRQMPDNSSLMQAMATTPISYNYEPIAKFLSEKITAVLHDAVAYNEAKSMLFSDKYFLVGFFSRLTDLQLDKFTENENNTIKVSFTLSLELSEKNTDTDYPDYKYKLTFILGNSLYCIFYTNNEKAAMAQRGFDINVSGLLSLKKGNSGFTKYIIVKE